MHPTASANGCNFARAQGRLYIGPNQNVSGCNFTSGKDDITILSGQNMGTFAGCNIAGSVFFPSAGPGLNLTRFSSAGDAESKIEAMTQDGLNISKEQFEEFKNQAVRRLREDTPATGTHPGQGAFLGTRGGTTTVFPDGTTISSNGPTNFAVGQNQYNNTGSGTQHNFFY